MVNIAVVKRALHSTLIEISQLSDYIHDGSLSQNKSYNLNEYYNCNDKQIRE